MSTVPTASSPSPEPAEPPAGLFKRPSASPKRLGPPGPDARALDWIVQAGLRAPDHGGLVPWRVIEFPEASRAQLADRFADEKRRRDPLAAPEDLERSREHATRPPLLLAFVVCERADTSVPVHEQWLAAGAALGAMLKAIDTLGFGGIVLSGERCDDPVLARELGVRRDERLAGFISAGTVLKPPREQPMPAASAVLTAWPGAPAEG